MQVGADGGNPQVEVVSTLPGASCFYYLNTFSIASHISINKFVLLILILLRL